MTTDTMRCSDCGAVVPDVPELRTGHTYVGAVAGCWAAYTELMGRQLSDPRLAGVHMLAVDVYMAQHPGTPGRQAAQSVWVHLVGLCLVLETRLRRRDVGPGKGSRGRARRHVRVAGAAASLGPVTVLDVLAAPNAEGAAAVRHWAESVWAAWSPHHSAIRQRTAELLATP